MHAVFASLQLVHLHHASRNRSPLEYATPWAPATLAAAQWPSPGQQHCASALVRLLCLR
jgi:hypothetical protein